MVGLVTLQELKIEAPHIMVVTYRITLKGPSDDLTSAIYILFFRLRVSAVHDVCQDRSIANYYNIVS